MNHLNLKYRVTACGVFLLAAVGCVAESNEQASEVGETTQELNVGGTGLAAGEFAYFRCNSTSWGLDNSSRMIAAANDSNITTLTYQVTQSWMVSGSDNCAVTVTNAQNAWGSQNSQWGTGAALQVSQPKALTTSGSIQIKYPALGTYTARINWASGQVVVTPGNGEVVLTPQQAAQENAEKFYAYLEDRFSWSGLDGNGTKAAIFIPAGPANNAQWASGALRIGAADGIVTKSFAYSADMIAHELTHGVIESTTVLRVGGEAGTINESLADVMAVFATATNGVADWRVGEEVWTPANPNDALRNLQDPHVGVHRETRTPCVFNPDLPYICGQTSHMDEYANVSSSHHVNNGILNRAAYLLVEGGDGVVGIGVSKAEQIYFRVLTQLLPERATFPDLRHSLETVCAELEGEFGITQADCTSVSAAMAAVGIPALVLDAPVGISGFVTEGGLPAVATVALYAGAQSPPLAPTKILEVTSDENGFYYFPPEDVAAELALHPPLGFVTRHYRVDYVNPDSQDLTRVAHWESQYFDENPFAPGTSVPPFDIGGLGSMTAQGSPSNLPWSFSWTSRAAQSDYYMWSGGTATAIEAAEGIYQIHTSPSITITDPTKLEFAGDLSAVTQWKVEIRGYEGTGVTNSVPLN